MLTEKQAKILKFIEKYQFKNGGSPTIREMKEYFGLSSDNSILKHLNHLEEKGMISKGDTPRSIKLLSSVKERFEAASNIVSIPVLSTIPAGGPVISEETVIDRIEIKSTMVRKPNSSFILKVSGRSMEGAGILDGDLVIVSTEIEPRNGDVVVALIDGGNTLKRFIREKGRAYLKAENPDYEDIYPVESLEVQGVVTGLIRNY
ncbi:MAG: SOS regulatory protein LexA, repressor LexA [Candidatus Peregrinibacteria bacterium GW2011_GWF2_43_17]|nr:MAG: SOS regulatory protein LexA, repressor LexA [Candidatus Peregrinibacteria bacterium GW2011_GWF2_43_17]